MIVLKTLYGNETITEPVLIELIASPSVQRLKKINQYGMTAYVTYLPSFSRYDHSIGVLVLLKKFHCHLEEQIAGLLHDVSHTVFSHVADGLFDHTSQTTSYQDDIHEWFINQTELPAILNKHGFSVKDILHKQKKFKALEQDLPHLCADRLEYNLHGAYVEKKLHAQNIKKILYSLDFQHNNWFFTDIESAQQFASMSLYLQQFAYTSPLSCVIYYWTAQLFKEALALNIITLDDIHFSIDSKILTKLNNSTDTKIDSLLKKVYNPTKFFKTSTSSNFDFQFSVKFRGIDPLIYVGNTIKPLTEIDQQFAQEFMRVKHVINDGWFIKFL